MKILFVCSSLEPGRDGVGDYTRRLAAESTRQGVDCRIIALNDRHLRGDSEVEEEQFEGPTVVRCLRLPARLPWRSRVAIARSWKEDFQPDCLSLQFVPYGYQHKGLPFGLTQRLRRIGSQTPWHIMFHELWIGMNQQANLKEKAFGLGQAAIIKNMIQKLEPKCISTQTQLYLYQLRRLKVYAFKLPIFGNIPNVRDRSFEGENHAALNEVNFLVFGSIHRDVPVSKFLLDLKSWAEAESKIVVVNFVGRNGSELERWTKELGRQNINYRVHGELDSRDVSILLSKAQFGIATTPFALLEKSGSVAAMLEHKLPVICVSSAWKPRIDYRHYQHELDAIDFYSGDWVSTLSSRLERKISGYSLEGCARRFLELIQFNGKHKTSVGA